MHFIPIPTLNYIVVRMFSFHNFVFISLHAPSDRLHSQSIDYSMLKELAGSIHGLKVGLRDEQRLIALFWLSELPQNDNQGNLNDCRLLKEVLPSSGESSKLF